MARLFAALDAVAGNLVFIGDAARGAACRCVCPECSSPLVAKQGDAKEWHFAHEGAQERPECEAGAHNMLRRLVVEHLQGLDTLVLPRYSVSVSASSSAGTRRDQVGWNAQPIGKPTWTSIQSRHQPVATLKLDNGIEVDLTVEIGDPPAFRYPAAANARGNVVFHCSVPCVSDLRLRIHVDQHIRNAGAFWWRHQPDVFGLVEAKRKQLQAADDESRSWLERSRRLRATPPAAVASDVGAFVWAPGRKIGQTFTFFRLEDGSGWVLYTLQEEGYAIAPYPTACEGWDEALPLSVGEADPERSIYLARSLSAAVLYLGKRSVRTRASSDPREFASL